MGTKLKQTKESFEDTLKELEDILKELENTQTPLEDLVERYKRAQECLAICRKKLDDAEMKIKKLEPDGEEDFSLESE